MALALYRKYRPRTFAEIIGQEHVTEPLSQALRTGRLHHAYLFSGPRGCGKTSSARILARSLNCVAGPTPEPCGECESCRALAPDGAGSIDVIEIDAASHGGVDDARDLRERAFFAPVSSRYKVYVIDEAHMVSSAGFNALLKLVEEPPEYVKFVFATTEPEKVLGTIKSRTHHYPFRLIPPGVLRPYLEKLCEAEGARVEPNVFPLVVRAGGGSGRDSLSILDQLIAGAGDEGVTYARAVALLGVTDATLIDEMCDALVAGDGAAVFATIDRVVEAGHDPRRFAGDLLARLRDLIVMRQVPDAVRKGLLDGSDDELSRMEAQAQRFGPATLSRMADVVHGGLTDMRGTTSPRLVLELIAARMLLPDAEDSTGALLQRLERMERRLAAGDTPIAAASSTGTPAAAAAVVSPAAAAPPAAAPPVAAPASGGSRQPVRSEPPAWPEPTAARSASQATATEPAPAKPAGTAAESSAGPTPAPGLGALDAAAVRRQWDMVLSLVRRANSRVGAMAREAVVRDVDGDTLVLLFEHQFHADSLSHDPKLLLQALTEVFGGQWQVRCELSGQQSGAAPASAAPARPVADRQPPPDDEPDWPEAAPVGGALPDAAPGGGTPARGGSARASAGGGVSSGVSGGLNGDGASSGGVGERAEAVKPSRPSSPRRPAATKTASTARSTSRPIAPAASAPVVAGSAALPAAGGGSGVPEMGFDDGDEPLDDDVEPSARQSSQDQAISLLRQNLGAETISDLDSR